MGNILGAFSRFVFIGFLMVVRFIGTFLLVVSLLVIFLTAFLKEIPSDSLQINETIDDYISNHSQELQSIMYEDFKLMINKVRDEEGGLKDVPLSVRYQIKKAENDEKEFQKLIAKLNEECAKQNLEDGLKANNEFDKENMSGGEAAQYGKYIKYEEDKGGGFGGLVGACEIFALYNITNFKDIAKVQSANFDIKGVIESRIGIENLNRLFIFGIFALLVSILMIFASLRFNFAKAIIAVSWRSIFVLVPVTIVLYLFRLSTGEVWLSIIQKLVEPYLGGIGGTLGIINAILPLLSEVIAVQIRVAASSVFAYAAIMLAFFLTIVIVLGVRHYYKRQV